MTIGNRFFLQYSNYIRYINTFQYTKVLAMAQIKGIIDQAHQNHELEQIKQMYHSKATTTLHETDENLTQTIESAEPVDNIDQDTESEDELQMVSNERNESNVGGSGDGLDKTLRLWELMLEDEKLDDDWEDEGVTDSLLEMELSPNVLSHCRHPQRDSRAKWMLSELFIEKLDAPSYINEL